jgi:hypothetical protein
MTPFELAVAATLHDVGNRVSTAWMEGSSFCVGFPLACPNHWWLDR